MPRRELLTEPQRLAFTEPATEEREMVRHYMLSSEDLALIDRRRGDQPPARVEQEYGSGYREARPRCVASHDIG